MTSPIRFKLPDGPFVCIQVVAEHTFRVRLSDCPDFPEQPLVRYGIWNAAADTLPSFSIRESSREVTVSTMQAVLSADIEDGSIVFSRPDGIMLTCSATPPLLGPAGRFEAQFRLAAGERFYGLGDKAKDRIQVRGMRTEMRTDSEETRVPIPFLMSSKDWGILLSTTHVHTIDIGSRDRDRLIFSGAAGELDFYLIAGDGYAALLDRYTNITGKPLLLPMWAYGLTYISHQYAGARDIIEDGLNFRREDIPCDMIGLEPGWMETYRDHTTDKTWHPERFAIPKWDPKGPRTFLGVLDQMGFKLSLWLCCYFDITHEEERLLSAESGTSAAGKTDEAWYDHLQKFVDQGVSAFKLEGFSFDVTPGPTWANGLSSAEMHHLYPLLLGKQMHHGFTNQSVRRSLIYSMNGYAGIQQYAVTWTNTQFSTAISLLSQSMSGNVNALTDMEVHSPAGMHFGFLQTLSQVNSWAYWQHPSLLEPGLRRMFRMYAKLRYGLLPYLYSAAHAAARTGMPVMRCMPLCYPDEPMADALLTQYMLGDSLLVCLNERVYLPEGGWIDYWTGEQQVGPREIVYAIPPHAGGPLFVRAGAIIPVWPEVSHIGPSLPEQIGIHVYAYGESGETVLYEDDGVTYGYLKGEVAETKISFRADRRRLAIRLEPRVGTFAGMPAKRAYEVIVRLEAMPAELLLNGVALPGYEPASGGGTTAEGWLFDQTAREIRLRVEEAHDKRHPIEIEIRYETNGQNEFNPRHSGSHDTSQTTETRSTNELIRQVMAQLDHNIAGELSLHAIAEKIHVNSSHLSRVFKREMGVSFSDYVLQLKMERAKQMLLQKYKIGEVAETLGFTDSSHFVRVFRKYWGITPGKLKPPATNGGRRTERPTGF